MIKSTLAKMDDSGLKNVGPFYNAVVVTDAEGNVFVVPKNETLGGLSHSTTYPWMAVKHPNDKFRQRAKKAQGLNAHKPKAAPVGSEKIKYLLKTGHSVLWERLPIHFITTLTRTPYYEIYSDAPFRLGNIEIIDSLQNISSNYLANDELQPYQIQKYLDLVNSNLDIKTAGMKNGWLLDRFKNIWMLFDAWERNSEFNWYVFFDDDTSILVNSLTSWLNRLDHNEPLYLGSPAAFQNVKFGHGGSGVAISHGAMKKLFGGRSSEENKEMLLDLTDELLKEDCGDYMVAVMLKKHVNLSLAPYTFDPPFAQDKFQGETLFHTLVTDENRCKEVVSFHHHSPQEISKMWEFENYLDAPIRYIDFYQSFVHPYLARTLSAWDNRAREEEYFNDFDNELDERGPFNSKEACQRKCEENTKCLQWRYDPFKEYCGLSTVLSLGRPVVIYEKDGRVSQSRKLRGMNVERRVPEEEIVSGWMLERIEERIVKPGASCNNGTFEQITEPFGWWWSHMHAR
ncbi:hypothetical protein D0Z00_004336 [Geotrichum galactomycetum]|uniref:Uncharacterized protein n=1 Tax=Geotrichum galactomycetum TaxID=27317 RepID=A0ACB6UYR3_9ASCO|nr:hypothetical protein D0Z00_004336 [Geotrichum candidum]